MFTAFCLFLLAIAISAAYPFFKWIDASAKWLAPAAVLIVACLLAVPAHACGPTVGFGFAPTYSSYSYGSDPAGFGLPVASYAYDPAAVPVNFAPTFGFGFARPAYSFAAFDPPFAFNRFGVNRFGEPVRFGFHPFHNGRGIEFRFRR